MFQAPGGSLPEGVVTFLFTDVEGGTRACRNPTSDQQPLAGDVSIKDAAFSVLTDLRSRLGAAEYDAAYTKGSGESFDFTLNEVLGRGGDQVSVLS